MSEETNLGLHPEDLQTADQFRITRASFEINPNPPNLSLLTQEVVSNHAFASLIALFKNSGEAAEGYRIASVLYQADLPVIASAIRRWAGVEPIQRPPLIRQALTFQGNQRPLLGLGAEDLVSVLYRQEQGLRALYEGVLHLPLPAIFTTCSKVEPALAQCMTPVHQVVKREIPTDLTRHPEDLPFERQVRDVRRGFELLSNPLRLAYQTPDEIIRAAYASLIAYHQDGIQAGIHLATQLYEQDLPVITQAIRRWAGIDPVLRPPMIKWALMFSGHHAPLRQLTPDELVELLQRTEEGLRVFDEKVLKVQPSQITVNGSDPHLEAAPPEQSDQDTVADPVFTPAEVFIATEVLSGIGRERLAEVGFLDFTDEEWQKLMDLHTRTLGVRKMVRRRPTLFDGVLPRLFGINQRPDVAEQRNKEASLELVELMRTTNPQALKSIWPKEFAVG